MEDRPSLQSAGTGIVARAKAILLKPKAEWPRIAGETTEPTSLLTSYAIPLIAIGPVAALIGSQLFPVSFMGVTYSPGFSFALGTAVTSFVLSIVGLFVVSFVANFLSPKFGGRDDWKAAFRLVVYSMTAAWVVGIVGLIPALAILGILALYSLYLFYLGATPVLGVPEDKAIGYTALTVVAAIVVQIVVAMVAGAITGAFGLAAGAAVASADTATVDMGELGKVEING
ncbi:MAG TPA: Yip1 family protein, partial [Croceibacterium sp.]|nr:Yip1 family protein [Croceibacterium sp.]